MKPKRILILGISGMLGHKLFLELTKDSKLDVYGTKRTFDIEPFGGKFTAKIRGGVDGDNFDTIIRALASIQPDIVINCIGLIKQTALANDPLSAITVNAQLPHRLSLVCKTAGARLIHFSTDCVFDGTKGGYTEKDIPAAYDLYGQTKLLGELSYPHCLTIRTSIIGHELKGYLSLVEWFLRQKKTKGYANAIFSGLPTIEIARVVKEYVLSNDTLCGVYHLSATAISKYDLLKLINEYYSSEIQLERFDDFFIDRSLDSTAFFEKTGYEAPSWGELVRSMSHDYKECEYYHS
ncbi:dTDP-4-dehydrorhamnose reductase family protein [Sulfuricurvum sp.]|uniref:dTDP-4-dehydrorhamnose reductase family protein n=1 Tax=Sulfuricurvum sp. TaxID=2025608 RepID=UPI003561B297